MDKKKETGKIQIDFIFGVFILMICLFISRVIYTYFDFYLTELDSDKFYIMPNLFYWKFAGLIGAIGFAFVLFIIDKQVLNFKFKGSLSIILIVLLLFQFFYPIRTAEDFTFASQVGLVVTVIGLIFPLIFLYIGIKTPGLRKISFIIAFGVIIYGFGSILVSETILNPLREAFGEDIHITMFFLFLILKVTGLVMLTYGVVNFQV